MVYGRLAIRRPWLIPAPRARKIRTGTLLLGLTTSVFPAPGSLWDICGAARSVILTGPNWCMNRDWCDKELRDAILADGLSAGI